ncbi:hypothetical protein CRG98_028354 [Punica granatum]|uniref:Uncharacterized protein n=1 Tax=Punica granatum TaxID=22663 RepID=A0A2I0J4W0_PUNGR|nr:hypothetical protein CRG98_028354 [Punica granatum]
MSVFQRASLRWGLWSLDCDRRPEALEKRPQTATIVASNLALRLAIATSVFDYVSIGRGSRSGWGDHPRSQVLSVSLSRAIKSISLASMITARGQRRYCRRYGVRDRRFAGTVLGLREERSSARVSGIGGWSRLKKETPDPFLCWSRPTQILIRRFSVVLGRACSQAHSVKLFSANPIRVWV